jgi:hypothetical protein
VSTDVAFCKKCSNVFQLSDLIVKQSFVEDIDLSKPPKGTWLKEGFNDVTIGATTRSPIAFFIIPFMLVWSGGSLGSLYGSQLISGKFDMASSLFGIPFLIGSIIFWSVGLMTVFGKTELKLTKQGGKVFTGIGVLGKSKKFTWDEISSIQEDHTYGRKSTQTQLSLQGTRRLTFGVFLNSARRYYIMNAFRYYRSKLI